MARAGGGITRSRRLRIEHDAVTTAPRRFSSVWRRWTRRLGWAGPELQIITAIAAPVPDHAQQSFRDSSIEDGASIAALTSRPKGQGAGADT